MFEGMLLASATFLTAVVAAGQWYSSSRAAARQRDVELTRWGHSVIEFMAELESCCFPISVEAESVTPAKFEKLAERGSALADMGRLFFPNYRGTKFERFWTKTMCKISGRSEPRLLTKSDGLRVRVLDDVIRATYVASHLASSGGVDRRTLRGHVWAARKSFVELLQDEMGSALRKVGLEGVGDHVPQDPAQWHPPRRQLPYAHFRGDQNSTKAHTVSQGRNT